MFEMHQSGPFFAFVRGHPSLRPVFTGKIGIRPLAVLLSYLSGDILPKCSRDRLKLLFAEAVFALAGKMMLAADRFDPVQGASWSLPPTKTASSNSSSGRLVKSATYRARLF